MRSAVIHRSRAALRHFGPWRLRHLLYEIGARCAQRVHSSGCPPSAAVRQRAMPGSTLTCFQRIRRRFRSTKAAPAVRMRSAISSAGGVTGASPPNREPHLYQNHLAITAPFIIREASAAGRLRPNGLLGSWPTNRHKNVILMVVNGGKMRTKIVFIKTLSSIVLLRRFIQSV